MFDRRSNLASPDGARPASSHDPLPGRSTLTQQGIAADAPTPPMFEDEPEWEELGDEGEAAVESVLAAAPAEREPDAAAEAGGVDAGAEDAAEGGADADPVELGADTAPPAGMIGADGSDAAAQPRDAGELPHRAQLEATFGEERGGIGVELGAVQLKRKPRPRPYAREDSYNRRAVKANHKPRGSRELLDRAGVRIHLGSGRSARAKDKWKLEGGAAARYRIVDGRAVEQVDTITDRRDLALNPARVRVLDLPGLGPRKCVFVWARNKGAAWLPIDALRGAGKHKIEGAVDRQASRTGPAVARGATRKLTFKATGSAAISARDRQTWIRPNHGAPADLLSDYLAKSIPGRRQASINVVQALPQDDAAPIATDFAQPGDPFFAKVGRRFTREVSLFTKGSRRRPARVRARIKWVFGYLGRDRPDTTRRGWVPLRVLAG